MAHAAGTVWEIRTTGTANGSAGYNSGGGGSDYSQQDAVKATHSGNLFTTGGDYDRVYYTSQVMPSPYTPIGNMIYIASGGTFTTGFYEITGYNSGSRYYDIDRDCCSANTSGGTAYIGGAQSNIQTVATALMTPGNTVWIESGTYTLSAKLEIPALGGPLSIVWEGYESSRGDATEPCVTLDCNGGSFYGVQVGVGASSDKGCNLIKFIEVYNQSTSYAGPCWYVYSQQNMLYRCRARDTGGDGFQANAYQNCFIGCEADSVGQSSTSNWGFYCYTYGYCIDCVVKDSECYGYYYWNSMVLHNCIADNCRFGFYNASAVTNQTSKIIDCISNNNTYDGFYISSASDQRHDLFNCIASNNGRYGFYLPDSSTGGYRRLYHCVTANNTSGDSIASDVLFEYYGDFDDLIDLGSVDPFVDSANEDFRLRHRYSELMGKSWPTNWLSGGSLTDWTSQKDIGPVQFEKVTRLIGG
jgi:hypothetical protein